MQDQELKGLGQRLREARETKGWTLAEAARELRAPQVVVEAMEREDWQRLGAPVFVRGRLSGYADLLGVTVDIEGTAAQLATPALTPKAAPVGWVDRLDRSMPRLAAVAGTVLLLPLLYLGLQMVRDGRPIVHSLGPEASLSGGPGVPAGNREPVTDVSPGTTSAVASDHTTAADTPTDAASPDDSPAVGLATAPTSDVRAAPVTAISAGLGTLPSRGLRIEFTGESWMEVVGPDGIAVERGLIPAGSVREYASATVARVTLGNAMATRVMLDGSEVNLDPLRSANVARFALSSDGLAPVRR